MSPRQKPVHRGIEFVFGGGLYFEQFSQRPFLGLRVKPTRQGERA